MTAQAGAPAGVGEVEPGRRHFGATCSQFRDHHDKLWSECSDDLKAFHAKMEADFDEAGIALSPKPTRVEFDATLSGQTGGAVPAGVVDLPGVDRQVESAISAGLDADQKAQPEWAWISYGDDLKVTWGRWQKHTGQAPYIRGDIVAAAINRARLAAQPGGSPAGVGEPFWKDGRRTLANGCCSAIEPCSWQQRNPDTLCETCTQAARLATPNGSEG